MNVLADDTQLCEPEIFFDLVEHWHATCPEFFLTEAEVLDLMQMPDPWLLHGESPLRAQLRLLSGTPDVTGWTTEHAAVLNEAMESPEAPTLLSLSNDVTQVLPASGLGADGGTTDE